MAKDLNFTSEKLYNFKFKAKDRGYDPEQVDMVLDKIIQDYCQYEENVNRGNEQLIAQIAELRRLNAQLTEQLQKEKNRVKYLPRDQKEVHIDNYELLLRIGKLESIIFEKLNINPDDIK